MRTPLFVGLLLSLTTLPAMAQTPETTPTSRPAHQLIFNRPAPEIDVTDLSGNAVKLADSTGKPVVLFFGSITNPDFRQSVPDAEKLAQAYGAKAKFLVIYQHEAYPADTTGPIEINVDAGLALAAPNNQEERLKLAKLAQQKLNIKNQTLVVDGWNDTTAKRYGNQPNGAFLIDSAGKLAAAYSTPDFAKLQRALDEVLAGRNVSDENRGPARKLIATSTSAPASGLNTAAITATINALNLSATQQNAILPPLQQYLNDLNTESQRRGATTQPSERPTPANAPVRTSAAKLQSTLQQNLSADEYQKMLNVLMQGYGRPFFTAETQPK